MTTGIAGVLLGVFMLSIMATAAAGAVQFRERYSAWFRRMMRRNPVAGLGKADAMNNASPGNMVLVGIIGLLIVGVIGSRVVPEMWNYPTSHAELGTVAAVIGPATASVGSFLFVRAKGWRALRASSSVGLMLVLVGLGLMVIAVAVFV